MKNIPAGSVKYYHLLSESMKMAFADRAKFMGDTDFVKIPLNGVINKEYAKVLKGKLMKKNLKIILKEILGNTNQMKQLIILL